jgi:hypothetical protein
MNRRDFFELFGAAALIPRLALGASPDHPRLPMGMNLAPVADWEPGFPFRNLMWGARLWMTRNARSATPWDTAAIDRFPLDRNGYPLEVPLTLGGLEQPQTIFTVIPNVRPSGKYVLLHDGEGDFEGVLNTRVVERAPGTCCPGDEKRSARPGQSKSGVGRLPHHPVKARQSCPQHQDSRDRRRNG